MEVIVDNAQFGREPADAYLIGAAITELPLGLFRDPYPLAVTRT